METWLQYVVLVYGRDCGRIRQVDYEFHRRERTVRARARHSGHIGHASRCDAKLYGIKLDHML